MSRLLLGFLFACLLALPAQAGSDPLATIKAIYKPYLVKDGALANPTDASLYSERRRKQIKAVWETCPEGDDCSPGFDFFINGQDYKLTELKVKLLSASDEQAQVEAQFKNMGTKNDLAFTLVKEKGTWLIDQLKGGSKETHYDLDELLKSTK